LVINFHQPLQIEAFEKCSFLFKLKEGENFNPPPNFGGLTTLMKTHRDRHPYIEYFEDEAKASLRAQC
jgi:hypothetical protein